MALTEDIEYDKIETVTILGLKSVQVRKATVIKKDGVELTRTFHRYVIQPGQIDDSMHFVDTDISGEPQDVKDICQVVFTQDQKDKWKAKLIEDRNTRTPLG